MISSRTDDSVVRGIRSRLHAARETLLLHDRSTAANQLQNQHYQRDQK
jgi:hypothetical protein